MRLITAHDLLEIVRFGKQTSLWHALTRFGLGGMNRTEAAWSRESFPSKDWSSISRIQNYISFEVTGKWDGEYREYIFNKYLKRMTQLKGLSLACGAGTNELEWASLADFKALRGIDCAPKAVEKATKEANQYGKNELEFEVGDVRKMDFGYGEYDVVMAQAALHHFSSLEGVLLRVKNSLKVNGLFLVDEYVGPNRFQWTDTQLKQANDMLSEIPERYRKRWRSSSIKKRIYRPGLLRMILSDPSEAIESEQILPLLEKHFRRLEIAKTGGTLLHLVFHDIGWNFDENDPKATEIIDRCVRRERELIDAGSIESDFVLAVYERP